MIGYKLFTPTWEAVKGHGVFQYEVGKSYEDERKPQIARCGFHFCKNLMDCFSYYGIEVHNRIALIEVYGEISGNGLAFATNKIKIIKEIPWKDVPEIVERQAHDAVSTDDEKKQSLFVSKSC